MFEPGQYLNVDLELTSVQSLAPLLARLDAQTMLIASWQRGKTAFVRLELMSQRLATADQAITAFVRLLSLLSPSARRAFMAARKRCFNIGIQAGMTRPPFETELAMTTLAAVVALGATVAITVYEPEQKPAAKKSKSKSKSKPKPKKPPVTKRKT